MSKDIAIAGRRIGAGHPPYVIAELSGNHNGDLGRALALVEAAAHAGADAVKLQTYTPATLTIDAPQPDFYLTEGLWKGRSLWELYDWAHTPWEWHDALFEKAASLGLTMFSSPFDETAVDFLEDRHVPAYKIASFELVDLPLVRRVARTGKPLIMSTGMASLDEMEQALATAREAGADQIVLLHCVSGYPTPAGEAHLQTIPDLARRFDVPVGLSDHSLGIGVAVASVALGAVAIEKHVTLRRADGGPDAAFSLEPEELTALVRETRNAFAALGPANYDRLESEEKSMTFRRSLYVVADVAEGEVFSPANLRRIRPGFGLPPRYYEAILGRRATRALRRGSALTWDMVDGGEPT